PVRGLRAHRPGGRPRRVECRAGAPQRTEVARLQRPRHGADGMIDLHCHILPGLDDGAVDLAESVAMARLAAADGSRYICATPHVRHDHDVTVREIAAMVASLNDVLEFDPVTVLRGAEVAETAIDGLDDEDLRHVSLGGGGAWVLVEPAPGPLGDSLD